MLTNHSSALFFNKPLHTFALLCFALLLASNSCGNSNTAGKREREERLQILITEEATLTKELEKVVDPDHWTSFLSGSVKDAKENPEKAKEYAEGSRQVRSLIVQSQSQVFNDVSFTTGHSLKALINKVNKYGFNATNIQEAADSLETWKNFLDNINEQHKLRKQISQA